MRQAVSGRGQERRWTLYLDKRLGEPFWKVRWGDSPRQGADGYEVVEVVLVDTRAKR